MSRPSCFAVEHVRRMRGGTRPHLLRTSEGTLFVVKFQNNPCHIRILANEFFATKLALFLELPMPEVCMIEVSESLLSGAAERRITTECIVAPGIHYGSRYAGDSLLDRVFDHMPETQWSRVRNGSDLIPMLAFDKWVGNCDHRQAVFTKRAGEPSYRMTCIDQHYCFDGWQWAFPDRPLMGAYHANHPYRTVTGWDAFEPTLTRIEAMEYADLWRCAAQIPYEWYEHDGEGLFQLVETLHRRRTVVRDLITEFRESCRNPFPAWTRRTIAANPVLRHVAASEFP